MATINCLEFIDKSIRELEEDNKKLKKELEEKQKLEKKEEYIPVSRKKLETKVKRLTNAIYWLEEQMPDNQELLNIFFEIAGLKRRAK